MALSDTPRLTFGRLTQDNVKSLHRLALDQHVRRYLLDGEQVDRAWCVKQCQASDALFETEGVGMWLVYLRELAHAEPIGFCGFIRFEETGPEPQLLYALLPAHTGRGIATEIAHALVAHARDSTKWDSIAAGVDEPNRASSRVLEKLGFVASGENPGAFGRIFEYRLALR